MRAGTILLLIIAVLVGASACALEAWQFHPRLEEATLLASGGAAEDYFGCAVALSSDGSRALVGGGGSARVFLRTGTGWEEEAALRGSGAAGDSFGVAVALSADGSRALVGAHTEDTPTGGADSGTVRVFLRTGTIWAVEATMVASGGATGDEFGVSVALDSDGSRALVGARADDTVGGTDAGSARVFLRSGPTWDEEAMLLPSAATANDEFGFAVALSADGARVLVGGPFADTAAGADAGTARIFSRTGTTWVEEASLNAGRGAANDHLGFAVAISSDGSRALVSATDDDPVGVMDAGSARVFVRTGAIWEEEATLAVPGGAAGDRFGFAVALNSDGTRALVSAAFADTVAGADAGSARTFLRAGTTWLQDATLVASGAAPADWFGYSVAISPDGTRALVGVESDDTSDGVDAGSARVFMLP